MKQKKNQELVSVNLKNAYKSLEEQLKQVTPTNQDNKGLYSSPKGKEYYEAMLQGRVGTDMNIKEVKNYLEEKKNKLLQEAITLITENPELAQVSGFSEIVYSDFTSTAQTLDYLKTAITEDYPKIDNLNYEIITVPDAWKDNFSPAAYLQGKIDAPIDTPELIYINGEYSQSLFDTIEHEGYPGHMYQHTYFKQQKNIPTIRYLIDYNGYSEGWATYVEMLSYQYAGLDPLISRALMLNQDATLSLYATVDMSVHYDGWTLADTADFLGKYGITETSVISKIYQAVIENPANYLKYYIGYLEFLELKEQAKTYYANDYSELMFHTAVLNMGSAPFYILEKYFVKYYKAAN